jgi:hypothetical protein
LAKEPPRLHAGTIRDVNRFAVAQDKATPVEEPIARWTKANRRLGALAAKPEAVGLRIPLRAKSKAWPLADLIRIAAGHIEKHQAKLQSSRLHKS